MVNKTRQKPNTTAIIVLILLLLSLFPLNGRVIIVAAQSAGDTVNLPTKTTTPRPSITPAASPTPTPAPEVWVGRLVSNTLGVTTGEGSIFRVSVPGILNTPIELRSGNVFIKSSSGSKPEYGPFAAEFAPVTKGQWTVSVPALNASLQVEADNYNLVVIEFVPVAAAEATGQPTSPPPAPGVPAWQGRIVSEQPADGVPFARLLVTVTGRDAQPVQISTFTQVLNTANTGQKPAELGPNTVEFTGLTPGPYFIDLPGLAGSFRVDLKPNVESRVEFTPAQPTAAPASPLPSTSTPITLPSATPLPTSPPAPTATPLPTATPPPPTATPVTRWVGIVDQRSQIDDPAGQISVKVTNMTSMPVRLTSIDNTLWPEQRCITGQYSAEPDSCTFKNLPAGWYTVDLEGVNVSLPVQVNNYQAGRVRFNIEVLPPGITGWQVKETQNDNGVIAQPKTDGLLRVKVMGQPGQIVALHAIRQGTTRYCEAVPNPILGAPGCEFGQLGPGVVQVEALHTNTRYRLFVDGAGTAELEFAPSATTAPPAPAQEQPLVGKGARPRQLLPTPVPPAPPLISTATPTATATLAPTATSTPAFAWQGRVVERVMTGAGAIGVRVVGLKDQPVIIRSGSWQSLPQLTGTKPELGDFATEFGGLPPAEYDIELVDLGQVKVALGGGEFMLVEFKYGPVTGP